MALYKYHYIELDTKRSPRISLQNIVAGETGNRLWITVTNNGETIDMSEKSDGEYIYRVCLVIKSNLGVRRQDSATEDSGISFIDANTGDHGKVNILLSKDSFTAGKNRARLEIYSTRSEENDTLIVSAEWTFDVEGADEGDNVGLATPLLAQYEQMAKSWATGGTGKREGEDTDNAAFYAQIARDLFEHQIVEPSVLAWLAANIEQFKVALSDDVAAWLSEYITPTTPVIDSSLSISGAGADAKVTGDMITDANINASYRVSAVWESGAIDSSTGDNIVNTNYSRTQEYIPTTDADYVYFPNAGANLYHYDLVDGAYVKRANKYVNRTSWAIDKSYGYFRISGGIKIANHPENSLLIYKYTKTQTDVETIKSQMIGKHRAPVCFGNNFSVSWVQTAARTTLSLPKNKYLCFDGFPTDYIYTNDIYTAANASTYTTVDGETIYGNNFAIVYNVLTSAITIVPASTYKYDNPEEIVLFAVAFNSFCVGAMVDNVIRKNYESNAKQLSDLNNAVTNGINLPDYWFTYLASKIGDVQSKDVAIGNHGDSFVFVTDLHYPTNDGNSAGAIEYVLYHSSITRVIIGGDICNGSTDSKQACIEQIIACRNAFRKITPYYLRGNHDNNTEISSPSTEKALSDSELYGLTIKPIENKIVCNRELHYYFDNQVQKIRYICLDTGHPDTNVISDAQITWMQGLITELAAGWTVIVLTHQYYSTVGTMDGNGSKILAGLNAIYDTANAVIACVICGHSHADYMETTAKGFPVIATTCDVRGGEAGGLTRTDNTYTEQAFDVFHIDTTAREIYATRIGAGSDRQTTY